MSIINYLFSKKQKFLFPIKKRKCVLKICKSLTNCNLVTNKRTISKSEQCNGMYCFKNAYLLTNYYITKKYEFQIYVTEIRVLTS